MEKKINLNVTSEIGKLKGVLLHRPGKELERLTPDLLKDLLFDDIPWLKAMQEEHDAFADLLRSKGANVYYVEELLAESLTDDSIKKNFISDIFIDSGLKNDALQEELIDALSKKTNKEVAQIAIAGLGKDEIEGIKSDDSLWDMTNTDYPLYINPIPNLYFTRDPSAVISDGISINSMKTKARNREPRIIKYIYKYHPMFSGDESKIWYNETMPANMEGGDQLVLSKNALAIGVSERTSPVAVETIAKTLFEKHDEIKEVLAVQIPAERAFMHLDTVFTMVDYDKFTIYPGILKKVRAFSLTRGKSNVKITEEPDLNGALKKTLNLPAVKFIESGGGNIITAAREQWNDSTNTLAIAPGVVVTYSRNEKSNEGLRKNGIEVLEINGSEMVRGRGGPRCMSCPLVREDL